MSGSATDPTHVRSYKRSGSHGSKGGADAHARFGFVTHDIFGNIIP